MDTTTKVGALYWKQMTIVVENDNVEIAVPFYLYDKPYFNKSEDGTRQSFIKARLRFAIISRLGQLGFRWPEMYKDSLEVSQPVDPNLKPCGPVCAIYTVWAQYEPDYYYKTNLWNQKRLHSKSQFKLGDMTEYGFYDEELEDEINRVMHVKRLSREDAITEVFNCA